MNNSGWKAVGHNVLVAVRKVERTTESGIVIADMTADKEQMAETEGRVVDIGPDAYSDKKTAWCAVGDRIKFGKYAGVFHRGVDGQEYRIIQDLDVVMVQTSEVPA